MNKFIFLDIDGVLNDDETYTTAPYGGTGLDEHHLYQLKHLITNTSAKVILSSDWKFNSPDWAFSFPNWNKELMNKTWKYLVDSLDKWGITIAAIVPHHAYRRGTEISMFLNDKLPCQYVILDDLPKNEFPTHIPHLVHINPKVGLTWDNVWEAQEKMKIIAKEVTA